MTDPVLYCRGPGQDGNPCGRPVAGHGEDVCSSHLKQLQRTGKMAPIAEKVSPDEKLVNLSAALAEADSDAEFNAALRALKAHQKTVGKASLTDADLNDIMIKALSKRLAAGRAAAKARGVRFGRPPSLDHDEAAALFELGKLDLIARVLGVSARTVRRALTKVGVLSQRPRPASSSGPRPTPEST